MSVIIPAHNAARTIGRAIASVRSQHYTDFQAIVIDDGSTDDTYQRTLAAIEGDNRFRVVPQANGGVAAARNRALAEASGKYVANLDADDMWAPEFLCRTTRSLEAAGPEAIMAFARSIWVDDDDEIIESDPPPLPTKVTYRELLLRNPIGNGSATLMRRDAVLARGGWDADLVRDFGQTEDWQLQLELAAMGEVVVVDEPLVFYRFSDSGASSNLKRSAVAMLEVIRRRQLCDTGLVRSDYWTARSLGMLWLLRRARRCGRTDLVGWMIGQIYWRNPLWFRERELRLPVMHRLAAAPAVIGRMVLQKRPGRTGEPPYSSRHASDSGWPGISATAAHRAVSTPDDGGADAASCRSPSCLTRR